MPALSFGPEPALRLVLGARLALELGEAQQMTGSAEASEADADRPRGASGAKLGIGVDL